MVKLKIDLHVHTCFDPVDGKLSRLLTPHKVIDLAKSQGFDAISITHHREVFDSSYLREYAEKQGIILIPGIEKSINRKHILLYNFENMKEIKSFDDIRKQRASDNLVIAPHPFYYTHHCLKKALAENIDIIDAIEYSHFYLRVFNPNNKAKRIAKKFNKPMIGFSDTHVEEQMGTTYSYVYAEERTAKAIIAAIKQGRIDIKSRPLTPREFSKIFFSDLIVSVLKNGECKEDESRAKNILKAIRNYRPFAKAGAGE